MQKIAQFIRYYQIFVYSFYYDTKSLFDCQPELTPAQLVLCFLILGHLVKFKSIYNRQNYFREEQLIALIYSMFIVKDKLFVDNKNVLFQPPPLAQTRRAPPPRRERSVSPPRRDSATSASTKHGERARKSSAPRSSAYAWTSISPRLRVS